MAWHPLHHAAAFRPLGYICSVLCFSRPVCCSVDTHASTDARLHAGGFQCKPCFFFILQSRRPFLACHPHHACRPVYCKSAYVYMGNIIVRICFFFFVFPLQFSRRNVPVPAFPSHHSHPNVPVPTFPSQRSRPNVPVPTLSSHRSRPNVPVQAFPSPCSRCNVPVPTFPL